MAKSPSPSGSGRPGPAAPFDDPLRLGRRHIVFGWWSLLLFLSLGLLLELLHGFKVGWYLNVSNESRRLMFTLAHAHGTLLALVHLAAGLTIRLLPACSRAWRRYGSPALLGASVLLPGGFLLGGFGIGGGDPGYGVVLVPLGALLLFAGVLLTGQEALTLRGTNSSPPAARR